MCSIAISRRRRSPTNYNNFYEFGFDKNIAAAAQKLPIRPWTVKFDGMVEKEMTVGIDDIIRKMTLEERLYRMRCVEAWSMAVPWTGFPMAKLVEMAKPLSSAKYRAHGNFSQSGGRARSAHAAIPVALRRRADDGGSDERTYFPRHRHLRQAAPKQHGAPLRIVHAVEVRIQIDQVDRAFHLHRQASGELLGGSAGQRVRILGQREPGKSRIRAGARRPRKTSAPAHGGPRFSSTATANMSPISTRAWRKRSCSCESCGVDDLRSVMAGLVPAIHVFGAEYGRRGCPAQGRA